MKNLYFFLFTILLSTAAVRGQVVVFSEDFNKSVNSFSLNKSGPGTATGDNIWMINAAYSGQGVYTHTPPQDSTTGGAIASAPYSSYLHISDSHATNGIDNSNWGTGMESDAFSYTSFCTMGMKNVKVSFYWLCEGNADSYGEFYYRKKSSGAWTKAGQAKYNGQHLWKYEQVQDANFADQMDLQIGFRWVNKTGGSSNLSFSIDDILVEATSDNSATISAVVLDDTVCRGGTATLEFHQNRPLCAGSYKVQMSDSLGNFSGLTPPVDLGTYTFNAGDTVYALYTLPIPASKIGDCFKLRIVRLTQPAAFSIASGCFRIVDCSNPPAIPWTHNFSLEKSSPNCVLGAVDLSFQSTGKFAKGNEYIAELIDTAGGFAEPVQIGKLATSDSFPGAILGLINGTIPDYMPEGCGYYIRVRSTKPATISSGLLGPFCFKRCDIVSNGGKDIKICTNGQPYASCQDIQVQAHRWDNSVSYDTCNTWTVQFSSSGSSGWWDAPELGTFHSDTGGTFGICLPATISFPLGIGQRYMRVVGKCGSQVNAYGTTVRFTLGAPDTVVPKILADDSIFCLRQVYDLQPGPYHSSSQYEWTSNLYNYGQPFLWPYDRLRVLINSGRINYDIYFYVREVNYGCYGPSSLQFRSYLTSTPTPDVYPDSLPPYCAGDTVNIPAEYLPATLYNWSISQPGVVSGGSNTGVEALFPEVRQYTITLKATNKCGSSTRTFKFSPLPAASKPEHTAVPDFCKNDSIRLIEDAATIGRSLNTKDVKTGSSRPGTMFDIIAHEPVKLTGFAVRPASNVRDFDVEMYSKKGGYHGYEQDPRPWEPLGVNYGLAADTLHGTMSYIALPDSKWIQPGDTTAIYLYTVRPTDGFVYVNENTLPHEAVYKSDSIIDITVGTANAEGFGAFAKTVPSVTVYYTTLKGQHYQWNTGVTTATLVDAPRYTPGTYEYTVRVSNYANYCAAMDTFKVQVNDCLNGIDGADNEGYALYPNPSTGYIYLQMPDWEGTAKLYNLQGQVVREWSRLMPVMDVSGLAAGQYVFTVKGSHGVWRKNVIIISE